MKKEYKTKLLLSLLLTLLPTAAGLLLWGRLPAEIAVHFNSQGIADGFAPKALAVFGLPVLLAVIQFFAVFMTVNSPKHQNIGRHMLGLTFWVVPILSIVVMGSVFAIALGYALDPVSVTYALLGILFLFMGNYMSKTHQNYTVGIKLPWTLNSTENWNKTHRLASVLWFVGGILFLLNLFFKHVWLVPAVILVLVIVPVFYSYSLYKKGI